MTPSVSAMEAARAAFERWYGGPSGPYYDDSPREWSPEKRRAWCAWQAALASRPVEAAVAWGIKDCDGKWVQHTTRSIAAFGDETYAKEFVEAWGAKIRGTPYRVVPLGVVGGDEGAKENHR